MVQSDSGEENWSGNLRHLQKGDRVKLQPGIGEGYGEDVIAEVLENPTDGLWIRARYISFPSNPSLEGTEEQIYLTEVLDRV